MKTYQRRTVSPADTAAVHDASLPPAASTPFVLTLAEAACIEAMASRLGDDEVSVGARAEIDHLAPSAVGAELVAAAELVEEVPPRYLFEVEVTDRDRTVARIKHTRAVISRAAIIDRLQRKG